MKTTPPPLRAARTQGSRIFLEDGRVLIDGIASWWTACHGYNHPAILSAVAEQLNRMPHIMFGGLVHEPAAKLAAQLSALLPKGLERVFFTDSGSVAMEVALKMAIQFWRNQNVKARTKFLAFKGAYHGDTMATMALCDPEEGMHRLFRGSLPRHFIRDLPRCDASLAALEKFLESSSEKLAALVVEPLVQGAGGMIFHDPHVLKTLRSLADRYGLLLICDEIFTGFGRTGSFFACEQAGVQPDIIALSKALTGGTMALAATVATRRVFDAFYSDDPNHALMHGPTFMANPLACSAALASLHLFATEPYPEHIAAISRVLRAELEACRGLPNVRDVRVLGAIGVVELDRITNLNALKARFVEKGVWVRPFGRIIYLTPAFTIPVEDLQTLTRAVVEVLREH